MLQEKKTNFNPRHKIIIMYHCIFIINDFDEFSPVAETSTDFFCERVQQQESPISVLKLLGFETFPITWIVSDSVLKNWVSKKVSDSVSEKNWYQRKYQIRYRKYLLSKKVSDSVSENVCY